MRVEAWDKDDEAGNLLAVIGKDGDDSSAPPRSRCAHAALRSGVPSTSPSTTRPIPRRGRWWCTSSARAACARPTRAARPTHTSWSSSRACASKRRRQDARDLRLGLPLRPRRPGAPRRARAWSSALSCTTTTRCPSTRWGAARHAQRPPRPPPRRRWAEHRPPAPLQEQRRRRHAGALAPMGGDAARPGG